MSLSNKVWTGVFLLVALLSLLVLASSISDTTYVQSPGLGLQFSAAGGAVVEELPLEEIAPLPLWQRALLITALVFATITTFMKNRTHFFVTVTIAALVVLGVALINEQTELETAVPLAEETLANETTDSGIDIVGPNNAAPDSEQQPPPDPGVAVATYVLVALVVALVVGVAGYGVYSYANRPNPPPLAHIAQQAEIAIAEIESGGDVRDAIMQCYLQMTQTVAGSRGVRRADSMTPREFEESLLAAGLPPRSVQRLTRLFEGVRYGGATPSKRQELEALSALREIVDFINLSRQSAEIAAAQTTP